MRADWGFSKALSFLVGLRPVGEYMFGGVCMCERGHPQTSLLARPPCTEECIWPLRWLQPQSVKDLEKHNRWRKRTQSQRQRWHVAWLRATYIPARLPGGQFLSLSFFMVAQLCPMGGLFYTLRGPAFWGTFAHVMWLSWEPLRWKTPNKVRPIAESRLFVPCASALHAGHLLAH